MPEVTDEGVTWRLADAAGAYAAVRLRLPLDLGDTAFHRNGEGWVLTRPRPPLRRLEYDAFSSLTRYVGALIHAGRLPRHRVALLHPGPRDEWYSASAFYARAAADEVLPAIGEAVAVAGGVVGMGTSLGGLATLHLQRRHPDALDGLFLQSSSFFIPRHDHMAAGFPRFGRIVRFVREVLRGEEFERPVPAALTCGAGEENLENNRRVTAALRLQGYDAALHELADLHNHTAWRDAFEPHLTGVLRRTWGA